MAVSLYAIAAMCGCQWRESSLNPKVWESGIVADWDTVHYYNQQGAGVGGFGLGQWTNTREAGGAIAWRLRDFHDWTIEKGYDIYNGDTQLRYIVEENVWFNVSHRGSNAQTLQEFLNTDSTDLDGLVWDFLANWEGVPGDAYQERLEHAREIYAYIQAHEAEAATAHWMSSNNYILPAAETLNNSLCYYRYFQGYVPPGPGPTPGKKKKMPLWMLLKKFC